MHLKGPVRIELHLMWRQNHLRREDSCYWALLCLNDKTGCKQPMLELLKKKIKSCRNVNGFNCLFCNVCPFRYTQMTTKTNGIWRNAHIRMNRWKLRLKFHRPERYLRWFTSTSSKLASTAWEHKHHSQYVIVMTLALKTSSLFVSIAKLLIPMIQAKSSGKHWHDAGYSSQMWEWGLGVWESQRQSPEWAVNS